MANHKKIILTEPQRIWLETLNTKIKNGESVSRRSLMIELDGKIPNTFNPSEIDSRLLRDVNITPVGMFLIDPQSELVTKTNEVIRGIRELLGKNPDSKSISAADIFNITNLPLKDIEDIIEKLSFVVNTFHQAGTSAGVTGWSSLDIDDKTFDNYRKYENLEAVIEEMVRERTPHTDANKKQHIKEQSVSKKRESLSPTSEKSTLAFGAKYCPLCNRTYQDNTLNFCLEDGTPLSSTPHDPNADTLIIPFSEQPTQNTIANVRTMLGLEIKNNLTLLQDFLNAIEKKVTFTNSESMALIQRSDAQLKTSLSSFRMNRYELLTAYFPVSLSSEEIEAVDEFYTLLQKVTRLKNNPYKPQSEWNKEFNSVIEKLLAIGNPLKD